MRSKTTGHIPGSAGHEVIYAEDVAKGKSVRAMTMEEIYELIEKFAEGAWPVQQSGFDCVELHGAHGYLIAQFMSPYVNRRNDRFGGSFINRMRFVLEIVSRIRKAVGPNYPIVIRLCADELLHDRGGNKPEESAQVIKMAGQAGAIVEQSEKAASAINEAGI